MTTVLIGEPITLTPRDRPPMEMDPVAVFSDRYGGTYSGGLWIAVADASKLEYDGTYHRETARFALILHGGPNGDDSEAMVFWMSAPDWVAVGNTPDEALLNLYNGVRPPAWGGDDDET